MFYENMYDSDSDIDEANLQEMILHGDFDQLDSLLSGGAPLDILDSIDWHDLMYKFLRLKNWKSMIRNIELLYLHRCTRQLEVNSNAAVYLMELKCSLKSWVYIVKLDKSLIQERLKQYTPRFDSEAMELYDKIIALCDTEIKLKLKLPAKLFKK
jgi:hypothetical protein